MPKANGLARLILNTDHHPPIHHELFHINTCRYIYIYWLHHQSWLQLNPSSFWHFLKIIPSWTSMSHNFASFLLKCFRKKQIHNNKFHSSKTSFHNPLRRKPHIQPTVGAFVQTPPPYWDPLPQRDPLVPPLGHSSVYSEAPSAIDGGGSVEHAPMVGWDFF